jgi:hypothetical protein
MIISRFPKTRASTEKAPGPRPITASRIVIPKTNEVFESNRFGEQGGSNERPIAAAPTATSAPAMGVRKPANRKAPAVKAMRPLTHAAPAEFVPTMQYAPSVSTATANTPRSANKQTPGQPRGNAKKRRPSVFVSGCLPSREGHLAQRYRIRFHTESRSLVMSRYHLQGMRQSWIMPRRTAIAIA